MASVRWRAAGSGTGRRWGTPDRRPLLLKEQRLESGHRSQLAAHRFDRQHFGMYYRLIVGGRAYVEPLL